jgi:soluble lytic murein transglycosylase-like protein
VATRAAADARPAICCVLALALGTVVVLSARESHADDVYSFRDRRGTQHFTNVPTDARFRAVPLVRAGVTRFSYKPRSAATTARRSERLARTERLWSEPPADLDQLIALTARRYGVETALVHAVVRAESAFDHLAISSAGAQGLMQLMPGTASEVGVRNAFHPQQNLEGGVFYLRQLIDRFDGNVQLAVAGYNAGPGAVERFGGVPPYTETIDYLERVFRYRQEYILSRRMVRDRMVVASR